MSVDTTLSAARALSPGEVGALLTACAGPWPGDMRDAAVLGVLYGSGLRRDEAVGLDVGDYLVEYRQLVVRGKGSKERLAHVASGTDLALDAWLDFRGGQPGPLFVPIEKAGTLTLRRLSGQAVRLLLQRHADRAGVAACTTRDLRRTFVSEILEVLT
jgi:site-specific recombinase XerD